MQIVIDINDMAYKFVQNITFVEDISILFKQTKADREKTLYLFDILGAIKNGIPLTKFTKEHEMREATLEELESVNNYIKSISKPTGVNIWDEIENEKNIDDIKVGDEVIVQDHIVGFVTEIDNSSGKIYVTTEHGWNDIFNKNFVKKTGRYFPNVAAILKAKFMKEANTESEVQKNASYN